MGVERRAGGITADHNTWADDVAQRVLRLEQRRVGGSGDSALADFQQGGECCVKVECYAVTDVAESVAEDAGGATLALGPWELTLEHRSACFLFLHTETTLDWGLGATGLVRSMVSLAPTAVEATILGAFDVIDTRIDWVEGVATGPDTVIQLNYSSSFTAEAGPLTISIPLEVVVEEFENANQNPPYSINGECFATLILVEEASPAEGPDCLGADGGGGEG